MAPLLVSRGGGAMGPTESDMPWEVGLKDNYLAINSYGKGIAYLP